MVTMLLASSLGLLYAFISIDTIKSRRRNQVSIGHGKKEELAQLISAHSNFAAYVPIQLFFIYLIESSNRIPLLLVSFISSVVLIGRISHFIAFRKKMNFKLRVLGMRMTLFPLIFSSLCLFYLGVTGLFY